MTKKQAQFLHNLVRYPVAIIIIPLRITTFILEHITEWLISLAYKWGEKLIEKTNFEDLKK